MTKKSEEHHKGWHVQQDVNLTIRQVAVIPELGCNPAQNRYVYCVEFSPVTRGKTWTAEAGPWVGEDKCCGALAFQRDTFFYCEMTP